MVPALPHPLDTDPAHLRRQAELVTFSVSPSAIPAVMVMATADTSQCPGGSGIPLASVTTRDTDSASTEAKADKEAWEVDMVVGRAVDMAAQAAADTSECLEPLTCSSRSSSYRQSAAWPEMKRSALRGLNYHFVLLS